jgi:competence protein ComEA
MLMPMTKLKEVWSAVQSVAGAPWAQRVGRAAGYLLGVALLAVVGSGHMARWLSPTPSLGLAVAEAATAPPPSVAASPPTAKVAALKPREAASEPPSVEAAATTRVEAEAAPDETAAPAANLDGGAPANGVAADGKVILNLASEEDLRRLPGVGHGRAQAILALRERMKKFTRVEDLLKVKGIGRRKLAQLRPLVRVD